MELNPSNPVTAGLHDHWHKLAAMLMIKQGLKEITITEADLNAVGARKEMPVVLCHDRKDGLKLILFETEREALEYVARNSTANRDNRPHNRN